MKMARVILFTGQLDAMSAFYGEVLGLKQVTNEKGWQEFAAGGARIALHSGPSSPGRKVRRLSSTPKLSRPYGKYWWRGAQVSARTRTAILFNCPTAENTGAFP